MSEATACTLHIAPPSDDKLIAHIKERFAEMLKRDAKDIRFTVIEDSSLIGGFIAYAGGIRYDASVKGTIDAMASWLRTVKISESA